MLKHVILLAPKHARVLEKASGWKGRKSQVVLMFTFFRYRMFQLYFELGSEGKQYMIKGNLRKRLPGQGIDFIIHIICIELLLVEKLRSALKKIE